MVGYLYSTDSMFKSGGYTGTESHFGVGGRWGSDATHGLDGVVYQWQDTVYSADANLDGWYRCISIETADNAPQSADDILPWTSKQVESIAQCVAWCCDRYNIPPTLVVDSKPGRRGVAYHRQGIDPWRVSGGELWSGSRGKECPADARISQLSSVVLPRVRAILNPPPPPPSEINVADEHTSDINLMNYVRTLFQEADGKMSRDLLLQHAAGQSFAANDTAGEALERVNVVAAQVAVLQESVNDMKTMVAAILANTTPPADPV